MTSRLAAGLAVTLLASTALADGLVRPPIAYDGSFNERAQEAIIVFHKGDGSTPATQDMILKISVEGDVKSFAWVVPLPSEPKTGKEDAKLFKELHNYVQARTRTRGKSDTKQAAVGSADNEAAPLAAVKVISRRVVGSYDVAVVKENKSGALNGWLKDNGYQPIENGQDVVEFYRQQGFVFACVKVDNAQIKNGEAVDLHPLRFSFKTGGRDGIFFPMRLTGLQDKPFDVNLYIFYDKWVNDRLSKFGYTHRGFTLRWRDYDSRACKPNAGKTWSDPGNDPYLKHYAPSFPTVTKLFQKLHPGNRYYLTNIYARGLKPGDVRDWSGDLWMFPYYTNRDFVPFDARQGGPAAVAYPGAGAE